MKKTFLALIAIGLFAASAEAYTELYSDTNTYGILGVQVKQGTPFTDEFNITGGPFGYTPLTEQLYSANATFLFTDLDFNAESLTISLANTPFGTPISSFFGAIVINADLGASALSDLNTDGRVSFTVTAGNGNAYLTSATLLASGGARVPDGGTTLTLLGLAFLGILSAQRKFAAAS
jgi:VPDSG-CTERM motif